MSMVAIKEVKGVVTCGDDGKASHVFNVRNSMDSKIRIGTRVAATAPAESKWLKIEGASERDLEPATMTQIVVNIQAPADLAPGKYSYRLRVFDPDSPGEKFTDGENVYFEVPAKKEEETVIDDNGGRRWILYAIAAAVVVLIIGIAVRYFTKEELVTVPNFETKTLFDALKEIDSKGLAFNAETGLFTRKVTNQSHVGIVVDQEPDFQAEVPRTTPVKLWVGAMRKVSIDELISKQKMQKLQLMKHVKIPRSMVDRSIDPEPESQ